MPSRMPPSRMSSGGGCCGISYDSFTSLIQVEEGRLLYCGRSWEVWSHAMSVTVGNRVKCGRAQTNS